MKYTVVIPARYGSTRLAGKALADIHGKPMVQHVYERALKSAATDVYVATDDQRVMDALSAYGSKALMTSREHLSGTDRLAEVVEQLNMKDEDILVNVQGDEPLIPPEVINQVAANLQRNSDCVCATLSESIKSADVFLDPSVVKVVTDLKGRALYFSRAPIPLPRDQIEELKNAATESSDKVLADTMNMQRHIGIYAYRPKLLKSFTKWHPAPPEVLESLEQLRILWQGEKIHVAEACSTVPPGVDTQADLEKIREMISS